MPPLDYSHRLQNRIAPGPRVNALQSCCLMIRRASTLGSLMKQSSGGLLSGLLVPIVHVAGGVLASSREYYTKLQDLLNKHDILLIEELITGFVVLHLVQYEQFGLKHDFVNMANCTTRAYIPSQPKSERIWKVLPPLSIFRPISQKGATAM
ncbi:hypothetical protein IVB15_11990 [Bradyrhizobium sp. 182]|uniref:hypothetical protein n=1 Tax=Bradyrhizobium sp. 182 TaxID=2782651 RepID=UPI001FF9B1B9|nr:hypothetical protein [Bradyrhizobium sp. 182]MCK1528418.1 hypothetical protein [Bradyrhizobium sp. 182]